MLRSWSEHEILVPLQEHESGHAATNPRSGMASRTQQNPSRTQQNPSSPLLKALISTPSTPGSTQDGSVPPLVYFSHRERRCQPLDVHPDWH